MIGRRLLPLLLLAAATRGQAAPQPSPAPLDPVAEKSQSLREAAELLDKANAARLRGARSFAEQLFSSAELLLGPDAVAELARLFREGAPPRVATPLKQFAKDSAPQPRLVGSSDEDDPEPPKPKRGSLSGTLKFDGKALTDGIGVITLELVGGKAHRRAPKQRVMEQRSREFAPHLLAVPVGSTVAFPNFDPIYHNVFSRSETQAFDLGIYKNGQAREMKFDKEGIVRLGCNLHSNMSAYIVVVGAPHYVITDADGRFSFRSLEPGKYKARIYSEHTREPATRELVIAPDKNSVSFNVTADAGGDAGTDKFGVPRGAKH